MDTPFKVILSFQSTGSTPTHILQKESAIKQTHRIHVTGILLSGYLVPLDGCPDVGCRALVKVTHEVQFFSSKTPKSLKTPVGVPINGKIVKVDTS